MAKPTDEETRDKAIRMLYAKVPRRVIQKELDISRSTLDRIVKKCKESGDGEALKQDAEALKQSETRAPACATNGEAEALKQDASTTEARGASAPIDRDKLARMAVEGMQENVQALKDLIGELSTLSGSERVYATTAVRKELRMTYRDLGEWGRLSVVENEPPPVSMLDDLADSIVSYKEADRCRP